MLDDKALCSLTSGTLRRVNRGAYAALGVVLFATAAPAHADGAVAFVPVLGTGLAVDEVARDEQVIRGEVDAHFGARSIPAATIHQKLDEATGVGLRCDRNKIPC